MREILKSLWAHRRVVWAMSMTAVRARYHRTVLGMAWAVLAPGLMALLIGVVYSELMGRDVASYAPYLFGGFFTWSFLSAAIGGGASTLTSSAGFVRQTTLPLAVYPLKHVLTAFVNFLLALVAIVLILAAIGQFHPGALLAVWPGVLCVFVFGVSICQLQSVIGTFFRDYEHLSGVTIRALFFITPVMYPHTLMAAHGRGAFFEYNPLHYLLTVVREPILSGELPPWTDLTIAAAVALGATVVSFAVFSRYQRRLFALL